MRVPESLRLTEATIRTKMYDTCRLTKRNRVAEAERRKLKVDAGKPIAKRSRKIDNKENEAYVKVPLSNFVTTFEGKEIVFTSN